MSAQTSSRWHRTFFAIWGGLALSRIGSTVAQFALVWWLTDRTGSAAVLASASAIAMVPQIVLGPLAGTYVDRWDRRITMIVSDGAMALLALALALLAWSGTLAVWHVYVILVGRTIGDIFHYPATQATNAMLVPVEHLPRIHGLNQTLGGVIRIAGPALGALALAWLPLHGVMAIDVVTALLAIVPLLLVRIPQPERDASRQAVTVWRDMRDGFGYLWALPGVASVILLATSLNLVLAPAFTFLPLYVRNVFASDAAGLSLVQAGFGAGMVLGGLGLSLWGHRVASRVNLCFGALVLMGLATFGSALAPTLWALAASWFVMAAFNAVGNGTVLALLQGALVPEVQGRAAAALDSMVMAAIPLGLAIGAAVVERLGLRSWYLLAAAMTTAGSLWALQSPRVRALDSARRSPLTPAGMMPEGQSAE